MKVDSEDSTDWDHVLKAKGLEVPLDAEGQHRLAVTVKCPWHTCRVEAGERCKPSLVFPQYPHTPRIKAAAVAAQAAVAGA